MRCSIWLICRFIALMFSALCTLVGTNTALYADYPTEGFSQETTFYTSLTAHSLSINSCQMEKIIDWANAGFSQDLMLEDYVSFETSTASGGVPSLSPPFHETLILPQPEMLSGENGNVVIYEGCASFTTYYTPPYNNVFVPQILFEDSISYGSPGESVLRIERLPGLQTPRRNPEHTFILYNADGYPAKYTYHDATLYDVDAGGYADSLSVRMDVQAVGGFAASSSCGSAAINQSNQVFRGVSGPITDSLPSAQCEVVNENILSHNILSYSLLNRPVLKFVFGDANESIYPHHVGIGDIYGCKTGEKLTLNKRINIQPNTSVTSPHVRTFSPGEPINLDNIARLYTNVHGPDTIDNFTAGCRFQGVDTTTSEITTLPSYVHTHQDTEEKVFHYANNFNYLTEPACGYSVNPLFPPSETLFSSSPGNVSTYLLHDNKNLSTNASEDREHKFMDCHAFISAEDTASFAQGECFDLAVSVFYEGCADKQTDLGGCTGPNNTNFSNDLTSYVRYCANVPTPPGPETGYFNVQKSFLEGLSAGNTSSGGEYYGIFKYDPNKNAFETVHRISVSIQSGETYAKRLLTAIDTLVEENIGANAGVDAPVISEITLLREDLCDDSNVCAFFIPSAYNLGFHPINDSNLITTPVTVPIENTYILEVSYRVSFPVNNYLLASQTLESIPDIIDSYGIEDRLIATSCVLDSSGSCGGPTTDTSVIHQRHKGLTYQIAKHVDTIEMPETGGIELDFRVHTVHDTVDPISLYVTDDLTSVFPDATTITIIQRSANMNPNYDGVNDAVLNNLNTASQPGTVDNSSGEPEFIDGDVYAFTVYVDVINGFSVTNTASITQSCTLPFVDEATNCFAFGSVQDSDTGNLSVLVVGDTRKSMTAHFINNSSSNAIAEIDVVLEVNIPNITTNLVDIENFRLEDVLSDMFGGNTTDWRVKSGGEPAIIGTSTLCTSCAMPSEIVLNTNYNGIVGEETNIFSSATVMNFGDALSLGFTIEVDVPLYEILRAGISNKGRFAFDYKFDPNLADVTTATSSVISTLDIASISVDPSGIVYDEDTDAGVADVPVTLWFDGGGGNLVSVPESCLLSGQSNPQLTNSIGMYQFDLVFPCTANPALNAGGVFTLTYTPSAVGYMPGVSVIDANNPIDGSTPAAPFNPINCGGFGGIWVGNACSVDADGTPAEVPTSQFYTQFELYSFSPNAVYNHIPIRQPSEGGTLLITKVADTQTASVGDFVQFTLQVVNNNNVAVSPAEIRDNLPLGLHYVPGSALVGGVALDPIVNQQQLSWDIATLGAGESLSITFITVVNTAATIGDITNIAAVYDEDDALISNIARATLEIVPEPIFDCSTVIGRVFDDANQDGYITKGEGGLPAIRLVTPNGWEVSTDKDGKYHIPCAAIPDEQRGSNFTLKLDPRSLPTGYRITTENPRTIRVTQGKMKQANFGASIARVIRIEIEDSLFAGHDNSLSPELAQQLSMLGKYFTDQPITLRMTYRNSKLEEEQQQRRMKNIQNYLKNLKTQQNTPLTFESQIIQGAR